MTEKELFEIENRFNKATPGPWVSSSSEKNGYFLYSESPEMAYFYHGEWIANVATNEDRNFIVHAIEDIPKLLNEIKKLRNILNKKPYDDMIETYCKKFGVS